MKTTKKKKKTSLLQLGIIIILLVTACVIRDEPEKDKEPQNIPVQSIEFISAVFENDPNPLSFEDNPAPSMNVDIDVTFTLTAKINPGNAANKGIIWHSSNTNIASINDSGNSAVITTKNHGAAVITIMSAGETASGGIASRTLSITVEQPQIIPVQSIDFGPPVIADDPVNIITGTVLHLTAIIKPDNATNKGITWDSNNVKVAAISGSGDTRNITAVGPGTAHITVLSAGMTENGVPAARTLIINVSDPTGEIEVGSITLEPKTLTFTDGGPNQTLTAAILPVDAVNKTLKWGSNNINVAVVESSGGNTAIIKPIAPGTATITVTSAVKNTVYATCSVTVNEIGVSSITLDKKELSLTVGGAGETLTAAVLPANAANKNLQWISGNPAIAEVESSGSNTAIVTPKASGTVTITVKSEANNTALDTCLVNVTGLPVITAPAGWIGSNDRLTVDANGFLRNRQGQEVVLRGINLGGWTLQESWMCPIYGLDQEWANLMTIEEMEKRGWSAAEIQALFDLYQENWITEDDFDWLQNEGINFLRISFWYRNFMSDDKGNWINNDDGSSFVTTNPGFKLLDWAFAQAAKRGMYVCLMMHGAVGGQSTGHGTGTLGKNELYTNPAYEQYTVNLWKAIVNRYKDEPVMAVLDLLGEPNNNSAIYSSTTNNTWEAGSRRSIYETVRIYDRLYRELRPISSDIILDMEAIWWAFTLPDPKLVYSGSPVNPSTLSTNWRDGENVSQTSSTAAQWGGKTVPWVNVMYSMHLYDSTLADVTSQVNGLVGLRNNFKVAVMNGEFNNDSTTAPSGFSNLQHWAYQQYSTNIITWASWTYKIATNGNQGNWSLHSAWRIVVNPMTDSQATIRQRWGSTLRTWMPRASSTEPFVYNTASGQNISGYQQRPDALSFWRTGLNLTISGVWTKSTASGFPVGGILGPITGAAAAK